MPSVDAVLRHVDSHLEPGLDRLMALLRFPSVGTDPSFHPACREAARWLRTELENMGLDASLRDTTGQPIVIGKQVPRDRSSNMPHILFYGHYDVQPAVPLDLWQSPPFEPQIRTGEDGRKSIFARGASDDKGQLMTFLEATRAWRTIHGDLPFRLTVILEGDEEGDSSHLDRFVEVNRDELGADAVFVCDTSMWDDRTPAITTRLRGCIACELSIVGPSRDLHSGEYGGAASNPIHILTSILGQLHDKNGRVTLPGFYDDVDPLPPALRRQWQALKFPAKKFLRDVGLSEPAGEKGYAVHEQLWARPTAEINGVFGGYTGDGMKTVIPTKATAKLTFRLVGRQEPAKIRRGLHDFVMARLPKDCKAIFDSSGGDNMAAHLPEDGEWVQLASRALKAEWGRAPIYLADGGSIPVVDTFQRVLGLPCLLAGWARHNDNVHSPNEKYDVDSFHRGIRSWVRIIAEMANRRTV